jgi:hypothetical protein
VQTNEPTLPEPETILRWFPLFHRFGQIEEESPCRDINSKRDRSLASFRLPLVAVINFSNSSETRCFRSFIRVRVKPVKERAVYYVAF